MARNPAYIGPRIKRLRRELGLTQANMAADLAISPSYVALIERNQRPVTADLLLRLATTYRLDIASFAEDGGQEIATRLSAVLREPLFDDLDLPSLDVADIAAGFPGFAEALLRLHATYEEGQRELAERREGGLGGLPVELDPVGDVRDFLASRRNCFPALDESAEQAGRDGTGISELTQRLKDRHGLAVRFEDPAVLLGASRWHSPHRREVFIGRHLDHASRRFQLAVQLGLLEATDGIEQILSGNSFGSENARRLAARALVGYWAAALLMPYRAFAAAAHEKRYDVEALAAAFETSFEQVAHRLTTLQRPGEEGVPFFFIRFDEAGSVSKRLDGAGFPFARYGGSCAVWDVHRCFRSPGDVVVQAVELPEGQRFVTFARTVHAGGGSRAAARVTRGVVLGCSAEHAGQVIYADRLAMDESAPIGVACRLCQRPRCIARAAPAIGRELRPDPYRDPGVPFAFADD
jgi:predicted transcriptional regulator/transcriptional regulator with XRE-family HTH domain